MRAAIAWVDALLCRWGRHQLRADSNALGYASCSILMSSRDDDGYYDPEPPRSVTNEDFDAISEAIGRLPDNLCICVLQVYKRGLNRSIIYNATQLRMDKRTLIKHIQEAQRRLAPELVKEK